MIFVGSLPSALALSTLVLNSVKSTYGKILLAELLDGSVVVEVVVWVKLTAVSKKKKKKYNQIIQFL